MPLNEKTPIDQAERNRALDTTASFAVSAPAGSGKTGLLTQRVLALLAQCDEPENILAITFTKKAAAEMQARILAALREAEQQTTEPEEDYLKTTWRLARAALARNSEKNWQLFSCPNRLRITTIDSLCRSISQQMPFESKLGNTPEILDNPAVAYQIAARETLAQLNTQNDLQAHLIYLVKHVDNKLDTIEKLLIQLLGKRDQWLPVLFQSKNQRNALENILVDVIQEQLLHTQKKLAPVSSELALLADHAAHNFSMAELAPKNANSPITHCLGMNSLPAATLDAIPQWLGLAELLLTQKNELRKSPTKDIGFFAPSAKGISKEQKAQATVYKERYLALMEHINTLPDCDTTLAVLKKLPSPRYNESQWQLLDSLTHILVNLAQNLTLAFQQLGKTDYLAVTLAALDALGEHDSPSDLALALDYKIQHILVDEFQDTSTTQLTLLQRLTAGWQPDDGRTLFVVGDAMQSCYRFRDANVGIFLDVREHGLGDIYLEPLDLQVNFRSQQQIVDWVNQSFSGIFPDDNDSNRGAVRYSPSVSFNAALALPAVQSHLLAYSDTCPSPRKDEAAATVNIIQRNQQERPNDSIAILVRSRAHAQDIIYALNGANIAYQATEIDRLNTCMPVLDCLSLTKALLYPNDRLAWLAVLRAPWCGLHMADLLAVAEHNKALNSNDNKGDNQGSNKDDSQKNKQQNRRHHWPLLLHTITASNLNQANLSPSGFKKLQRFAAIIRQALSQQKRHRLRHWIQGIWLALGGSALLINPSDEDSVNTFFGLLDKHEQGGTIPQWNDIEKAVNDLYATPKKEDKTENHKENKQQAQPPSTPAVQIMTIHKSKGLEFDTVIIPALDKGGKNNDKELLLWLERVVYSHQSHQQERQLLISPVNATGEDGDPIYDFIRAQHTEKEQLESERVLYVGCTRAIKQLHLLAYAAINSTSDSNQPTPTLTLDALKTPSKNTLLYRLWPSIQASDPSHRHIIACDDNNTIEENTATISDHKLSHPNIIASLSEHWQAPMISANHLLAPYRGNNLLAQQATATPLETSAENPVAKKANGNDNDKSSAQNDLFAELENIAAQPTREQTNKQQTTKQPNDNRAKPDELLQREQRYIGTVIHLALQHITQTGYKHWNAQRIQQQQLIWQSQLAQKGISPHKLTSALNSVTQAISQTLQDKTGQWLLDNTHPHSATELELWDAKGQHIIDRTFIEEKNGKKTRWIIDYKSSQAKADEQQAQFIESEKHNYQQQLKRYKTLFNEKDTEIRAALYFVFGGMWVEV